MNLIFVTILEAQIFLYINHLNKKSHLFNQEQAASFKQYLFNNTLAFI